MHKMHEKTKNAVSCFMLVIRQAFVCDECIRRQRMLSPAWLYSSFQCSEGIRRPRMLSPAWLYSSFQCSECIRRPRMLSPALL
jgi:hypothetical protein